MNLDAVAIYRNAFVGAIMAILGWLGARLAFGPFPTDDAQLAAGHGALIGLSLSWAIAVTSCESPRINWQAWAQRVAMHGVVGIVAGAAILVLGLGMFRLLGGLSSRVMCWTLLSIAIGVASGAIDRSGARIGRAAFAGCIAGLVGGSTLEALFVWAHASGVHVALATTMAGVYGLGLLGGLICAIDRLTDDVFRSAWLYVETGKRAGRSKTLDLRRAPVRIGSSPRCELRLVGDAAVERHHASVGQDGGSYYVASVAGTTFAGPAGEAPSPVTRSTLADRSEILVGDQCIRFCESRGPA